MLTISRLFIYPIKSCAPVEVESLVFDEAGPVGDRRFMLVDEAGRFLTQRSLPAMAFIQASYQGNDLYVTYKDENSALLVSSEDRFEQQQVQVWNDVVTGADCGDQAAEWFSRVLEKTCRLVAVSNKTQRQVNQKYAKPAELVGFADGFPVLVVSQSSLDALSASLGRELEAERFRPNIMVEGSKPFEELQWKQLRANKGLLAIVKPCERCVIPTRNLKSQKKETDVVQLLKEKCLIEGKIIFGQNALVRGISALRIGDSLASE